MEEKIKLAKEYADAHGNTLEAVNDASNIYADSYEEYEYIFCSIGKPYIKERFYQ